MIWEWADDGMDERSLEGSRCGNVRRTREWGRCTECVQPALSACVAAQHSICSSDSETHVEQRGRDTRVGNFSISDEHIF
jgi:hypothetical protein